jgi:pyrroline-5-carboxylate reductase
MMRIGFIGTGHLAEAIVTALCQPEMPACEIFLSPRSEARADRLATRFRSVTVARDNDAVVRQADVVMIAVRPEAAEAVLTPLAFRDSQRVISLMAAIPLAQVEGLVHPAPAARVLCLPTVAVGEGAMAIHPDSVWARAVFQPLGDVAAVENEYELEILWSVTGLMATQIQLISSVVQWVEQRGVSVHKADRYVRRTFAAITQQVASSKYSLDRLVGDAQTKGGLNEQALRELQEASIFEAVVAALNHAARRLLNSEGELR